MRITKKDLKQGIIKVVPEDADDIWDLHSVLEAGDHVRASTERKINLGGEGEKSRVIKKRVTLTITVEKVDYDSDLRVLGKVIDGPEDIPRGSAHSFGISEGEEIGITKNWAKYQISRLVDATKERSTLLVILFDREKALFLSVTGRGVTTLSELKGNVNKKAVDESVKSTFYQDIIKTAQEYLTTKKPAGIVFGSPAFWQDYIKKVVPKEMKAIFTTISDVERTAVKELVQRPELQKLLKNNRTALEMGYVEEIMQAAARDKLAYGDEDVQTAISSANVKSAFLTETRIQKEREKGAFAQTEKMLRDAEKAGGAIHILSSTDSCREIDGLGGFVVMLRW